MLARLFSKSFAFLPPFHLSCNVTTLERTLLCFLGGIYHDLVYFLWGPLLILGMAPILDLTGCFFVTSYSLFLDIPR